MRDVCIIGIGQIPAGEHWDKPLRILGSEALCTAVADAHIDRPQAVYVGNMLSGQLSRQANLGALIADYAGFRGVEAYKIEAACASGAAAVRAASLAVSSGEFEIVAAVGVEKMTDTLSGETTTALAAASDSLYEAEHGLSFVSLNALLMRRYMYENGWSREDFANFAVNAHANAVNNPNAMFRKAITAETYRRAKMIADPVCLFDSSAIADGAAAVILAPTAFARANGIKHVRLAGSGIGTDSVALHDRKDPLFLSALHLSVVRALDRAGIQREDIDFYELHDAFTIMSALSLEAAGFAERGRGVGMAVEGRIMLDGDFPVCTMGGLKARGHPVGASGLYQIVEAALQLRGDAGKNQLDGCEFGLTTSIGGSGATVVSHVLQRQN